MASHWQGWKGEGGGSPPEGRARSFSLARWFRRAALVTLCSAGVLGWGAARGRAALHEGARDAGQVFFGLADSLGVGHHRVWLNGLAFDIRSRVLGVEGEALLDALEVRCDARDAGLGELLGRRLGSSSALSTAYRLSAEGAGMLACLDLGEDPWTREAWRDRLETLRTTGDFAALGQVRLARVKPTRGKSHLVTVAARGTLKLQEAFPAQGDAPGADLDHMPRPGGARRILSAFAEGHSPGVWLYEAQRTSWDVEAWLAAWRAEGFSLVAQRRTDDVRAWLATRGTTRAVLSVDASEARSLASISVLSP